MKSQKYISAEEALDWLVNVAAADGLITQSEQTVIRSFADSYHINADDIIEKASHSLIGIKPEVEIIDYRAKNGLLFEQLIASFLKDKKRFSLLSWTGDKYVQGIFDKTNLDPDLHIQQIINNVAIDYYIECKWHHYWQRGKTDYFYEISEEQLARYRTFQRKNQRNVLVAYAYGRTGDNPRGIYLIPLNAFHNASITKRVADTKYRIQPTAEAFAQYIENYFAKVFSMYSKIGK